MQPFTLLIKPSGSDCNLDCRYCFYKKRPAEIGHGTQRMSEQVLEKLVKDYLSLALPVAGFSWQGGEPTLMGLHFYKTAVELQKKYAVKNQTINNSLQTNAILLDDKWCRFLHDNKFLVGISIDGPEEFHNYYRVDSSGGGTFDKVTAAIQTCKKYKVEFNTLTLLNDRNVTHPDHLFDFFIANGVEFLQFIPCVEKDRATGRITDFSITPPQYGEFLCKIFDRWYDYRPPAHRPGLAANLSIRAFDSILSYCLNGRHTICTFDKRCSQYIVVEHTGDCFCCDFFVEPKWHLGNIFQTPIEKLAAAGSKRAFGRLKQRLPDKCLVCEHLDVCRGGCLKDRAILSEGFEKESYFCQAYKRFFDYTMPRFMQVAADLASGKG